MNIVATLSLPRPGPVARISFGLMSLIISLVLAFDVFFGALPTRFDTRREVRNALASSIGVQAATLLEQDDRNALESAFAKALQRERDIVSMALRRGSGELVVQAGGHAQHWDPPPPGKSTLNHVRVPLYSDGMPWGDLEISFVPLDAYSLSGWLREPLFVLLASLGTIGLALVFLYMRRSLEFLDPSSAVPERVRQAFDTFVDAVVIVDAKGRVMLANHAFRQLVPDAEDGLYGKPLTSVQWLTEGTPDEHVPWAAAIRSGRPVNGIERDLPARTDGEPGTARLGCSPLVHHDGSVRGCLITLHDVTDLQRANDQLRTALRELEISRQEIEVKNAELHEMAIRDGLTGCLNRRAFVDHGNKMFDNLRRQGRTLSALMLDIDHFKSVNDTYGHSVGDQVIKLVATALMKQLRSEDLLCRYGGEEFCVLLPDVGSRQARAIAERLRDTIEANVGRGLRRAEPIVVTASVGAAGSNSGAPSLEQLVNSADAALYESKRAGRNRVTVAE